MPSCLHVVSLELFGSHCHPACPSPGLQECLAIHVACILEARRNQCNPSHMCVTCVSQMMCIPPCGAVIREEKTIYSVHQVLHLGLRYALRSNLLLMQKPIVVECPLRTHGDGQRNGLPLWWTVQVSSVASECALGFKCEGM